MRTNTDIRTRMVAEARKYLDVPFFHRGRDEKGIDCVGLLQAVGNAVLGFDVAPDYFVYPKQPTNAFAYRRIKDFALRISREAAGPGDVVLIHHEGFSTHYGILTDKGVIHASRLAGRVLEQSLESLSPPSRIVAFFRFFNVPAWNGGGA